MNDSLLDSDDHSGQVATTLVKKVPKIVKFTSKATDFKAHQAIDKTKGCCRLCTFSGSAQMVKTHTKHHFLNTFCACGFSHLQRTVMIEHLAQEGAGCEKELYEVDEHNWQKFMQQKGLPATATFGDLLETVQQPEGKEPTLSKAATDIRQLFKPEELDKQLHAVRKDRKERSQGKRRVKSRRAENVTTATCSSVKDSTTETCSVKRHHDYDNIRGERDGLRRRCIRLEQRVEDHAQVLIQMQEHLRAMREVPGRMAAVNALIIHQLGW